MEQGDNSIIMQWRQHGAGRQCGKMQELCNNKTEQNSLCVCVYIYYIYLYR